MARKIDISFKNTTKENEMYEYFIQQLKDRGLPVQTGVFGAMMEVELINDGPVTFILN